MKNRPLKKLRETAKVYRMKLLMLEIFPRLKVKVEIPLFKLPQVMKN